MNYQIQDVNVEQIRPNPEQPRKVFKPKELQELAESIRERGLVQPIVVYNDPGSDGKTYTLVMGERRVRAHEINHSKTIKAIVYESKVSDKDLLIDAMVENVQRDNMNVVDEGEGYQRLRDVHKMSVRKISKQTGVYEARIHAMLKIADLEPQIKDLIRNDQIPGSDKAIAAYFSVPSGKTRIEFCKTAATTKATIKMIESAARKLKAIQKFDGEEISQEAPAVSVAKAHMSKKPEAELKLSNWNALAQAGKVPPWSVFKQSVENTCNNCSLRSVASPATCSECPLVDMVRRSLEVARA